MSPQPKEKKQRRALHKTENERITERFGIPASIWKRGGYRRLQVMLEREGTLVDHKMVYQLDKEASLSLRKKHRKKNYLKQGMPDRLQKMVPNERWSIDFGKGFKVFTLLDKVTHKCLALGVGS